uniref:Uncharacterized protein n=1 Tax=uncultured marine virus TaxID=186617 RepID=A0A0F7LBZ4_9VIRU|nr:hypothetical protein [uncultured marine virus]
MTSSHSSPFIRLPHVGFYRVSIVSPGLIKASLDTRLSLHTSTNLSRSRHSIGISKVQSCPNRELLSCISIKLTNITEVIIKNLRTNVIGHLRTLRAWSCIAKIQVSLIKVFSNCISYCLPRSACFSCFSCLLTSPNSTIKLTHTIESGSEDTALNNILQLTDVDIIIILML